MKDLIAALNIFLKYEDSYSPTHCEHDVMYVAIDPNIVTEDDIEALDKLSFSPDTEFGGMFRSYRFGSC